jgi:hypothetical protein
MKLKNLWLGLLLTGFAISVQAQTFHDPNAEPRKASGFHAIEVSNAFDVYLTQADAEGVAVSAASEKDREKIIVEVKDGVLQVRMDKKFSLKNWNRKLKAYISFKSIDRLDISGACDVFIQGRLSAPQLKINQSGASDLKGEIDIQDLKVELSGASDIHFSGKATKLKVEVSGASSFHGYELQTEACEADASGASEIRITVNKELSADASGASDVKYKGDAVLKGGGSGVRRM